MNRRAFGRDQEANLVDSLRSSGAALLSLIATLPGRIVGHILYSPVSVGTELTGAGLGPMAVLPEYQGQGIGRRLVEAGNRRLAESGCPVIVVLGHPHYYPRFGFRPALEVGLRCEWDVPTGVFMALTLDQTRMDGVRGLVRYRQEFSAEVRPPRRSAC